jgi:hypothetical protein
MRGMHDLGYVEGQNLAMEHRYAPVLACPGIACLESGRCLGFDDSRKSAGNGGDINRADRVRERRNLSHWACSNRLSIDLILRAPADKLITRTEKRRTHGSLGWGGDKAIATLTGGNSQPAAPALQAALAANSVIMMSDGFTFLPASSTPPAIRMSWNWSSAFGSITTPMRRVARSALPRW